MSAAYVVKHHYNARFRQFLVFAGAHSAQFYVQKFPVLHINPKSYQHKGNKNKKMSIFAVALKQDL